MKIIFLKDVPKLGKKDDVKEMNDGYVRNFLLPGKLVEVATPAALAKLNERKAIRDTENAFYLAKMETIAKAIEDKTIEITALANEKDILFKAITAKDVTPLFAKVSNVEVKEEFFPNVHIKTVGEHLLAAHIGNKIVKCNLIIKAK